jgi:hypothetical protein
MGQKTNLAKQYRKISQISRKTQPFRNRRHLRYPTDKPRKESLQNMIVKTLSVQNKERIHKPIREN